MHTAELSTCYGWRGKTYGPGLATIPDDLAIALGLSLPGSPAVEEPPPPGPEPPFFPALVLINGATAARSLTPIPTIGIKAATIIFEQRPQDGYPSMGALPAEIFAPRFGCDQEQIEAWEG